MLQNRSRYPRLTRRLHVFYIRVAIPTILQPLALRRELVYSLGTRDYYTAIKQYPKESLAMDAFIDFLKVVALKISKRTHPFGITMDDADIDALLVHRLEEVQKFCEDKFNDIENHKADFRDISVLNNRDVTFCAGKYLNSYLLWLYQQPDTHITLKNVLEKIMQGLTNIPTSPSAYRNLETVDWFKSYINKFQQVESYNEKLINDIQHTDDTAVKYANINPLIRKLTTTCQDIANKRIEKQRKIKTLWTTLFNQMTTTHNLRKKIKESSINSKRTHLETIFALLEKDCIDDITAEDCKRISIDIHRVPKRWRSLYPGKRLNSILLPIDNEKCFSIKTIKAHLISFQELLKYAVDEGIIPNDFKKNITVPLLNKEPARISFSDKALKKIFNPETYPSRYSRYEFVRFWVPLIALHQGCRINEICQLRTEDIIRVNGIWCFNICANHKDQSLKNKHSKRIIPVHPNLIFLGFIDFVKKLKTNKKEWVFYTIKRTAKNQHSGAVGHWFARYLDKLGIISDKVVFHSFRYTFEEKAIEKKISTEVQNALGGWANKGIGQSIYGKNINISLLNRELKKIDYPCLKQIFQRLALDPTQQDYSCGDYELSKKRVKKKES